MSDRNISLGVYEQYGYSQSDHADSGRRGKGEWHESGDINVSGNHVEQSVLHAAGGNTSQRNRIWNRKGADVGHGADRVRYQSRGGGDYDAGVLEAVARRISVGV